MLIDAQGGALQDRDADDEEEEEYIYVDLSGLDSKDVPGPGTTVTLRGLDTSAPQLQLADGRTITGEYEESLGSLMFFTLRPRPLSAPTSQPGSSHGGTEANGAAGANGEGAQVPGEAKKDAAPGPDITLLCHTEQCLRFKKPP